MTDVHPIITSAVVVESGDLLIIGIAQSVTAAEAQRITKALAAEMGG